MPSQDALEPLIDVIGSFVAAVTSPVTMILVLLLVLRVRNPWWLAAGVGALAGLETALGTLTGSSHLSLPLAAASHGLAILAQLYAWSVVLGAMRGLRQWVRSFRSGWDDEA